MTESRSSGSASAHGDSPHLQIALPVFAIIARRLV